jgi:hypothetical protein
MQENGRFKSECAQHWRSASCRSIRFQLVLSDVRLTNRKIAKPWLLNKLTRQVRGRLTFPGPRFAFI